MSRTKVMSLESYSYILWQQSGMELINTKSSAIDVLYRAPPPRLLHFENPSLDIALQNINLLYVCLFV